MSSVLNPAAAAWSMVRSIAATRRPAPQDDEAAEDVVDAGGDHGPLAGALKALADGGAQALPGLEPELADYQRQLEAIDPDRLSAAEALAFWVNLYNTGALRLAAEAAARGDGSVLGVPGAFRTPFTTVVGEVLSLDAVEHGKVRRFGDPRVHAALVCGSVSCPSLRPEPYRGANLSLQLDQQLAAFFSAGAAVADRESSRLLLSRVFLWYGADWVRPHRMPSLIPVTRKALCAALVPWLPNDLAEWVRWTRPDVAYQRYDWGLRCTVG